MINKKVISRVKKTDSVRTSEFSASAGLSKYDNKFPQEIGSGSQLPDIYQVKKPKKKKTQYQKDRDEYVEQLLEK